MRCHICDAPLGEPHYNRDHQDFSPCGVCMEIINNVFEDPVPEEQERINAEQEFASLYPIGEDEPIDGFAEDGSYPDY